MTTFLFWNMQRKGLGEVLFRLVERHKVDVLMLAECSLKPGAVLEILNRENSNYHFPRTIDVESEKIRVFTRFSGNLLESRREHDGFRWTIRQLFLPNSPDIIIVALHLPSKSNWDDASLASVCWILANDIIRTETEIGHQRTVVVGDFNMNPFEAGMIGAPGLNCEMTQTKVLAGSRTIHGVEHPFFYNPMWNFFGDATSGPAGTYHFRNARPVRMSWNMFDQVLLRSELLPLFDIEQMEILTSDGENSFLTAQTGVPGANGGSDHLPILFKLNL